MGAALKYEEYEEYENVKTVYNLGEFIRYIELPENEDKRYELIFGRVFMMASATGNHQRICWHVSNVIGNYLKGKKCEAFNDISVYLKKPMRKCEDVYRPDIIIGCKRELVTEKGYEGTPDFVVEVISKSTAKLDYWLKLWQYMEFGVKEYWIIDMYRDIITVYKNNIDDMPEVRQYTFADIVESAAFSGLRVDFREIKELLA
jgi:Uma2 family endonuclease